MTADELTVGLSEGDECVGGGPIETIAGGVYDIPLIS